MENKDFFLWSVQSLFKFIPAYIFAEQHIFITECMLTRFLINLDITQGFAVMLNQRGKKDKSGETLHCKMLLCYQSG